MNQARRADRVAPAAKGLLPKAEGAIIPLFFQGGEYRARFRFGQQPLTAGAKFLRTSGANSFTRSLAGAAFLLAQTQSEIQDGLT
jgi:hypothetical protein